MKLSSICAKWDWDEAYVDLHETKLGLALYPFEYLCQLRVYLREIQILVYWQERIMAIS